MNNLGTFGKLTPLGQQQLTGLVSAQSLIVPAGARLALIVCDTQNVRWRDDKTDPTTGVGMLMKVTDDVLTYSGNLGSMRFIEVTASAFVNISYYG